MTKKNLEKKLKGIKLRVPREDFINTLKYRLKNEMIPSKPIGSCSEIFGLRLNRLAYANSVLIVLIITLTLIQGTIYPTHFDSKASIISNKLMISDNLLCFEELNSVFSPKYFEITSEMSSGNRSDRITTRRDELNCY
jgi:hypothetical protein